MGHRVRIKRLGFALESSIITQMRQTGLQKMIADLAEQIARDYRPEKIILFGSIARGEGREHSDIDLLIIKRTRKRMIDRIGEVLAICDHRIPVEPIVYTPAEIRKRLKMGDFFIREILEEGKVLYG